MERTVFRGISYKEALSVVKKQKYDRDEARTFQDGVAANAVFGSGVYLLSDVERAAEYAFCHAEFENDLAAVLIQQLYMTKPMILNLEYGEERLREDALQWKSANRGKSSIEDSFHLGASKGNVIREYILHLKCDGIIYQISEEMNYYVSYFPEKQIKNIQIDFVFDINDLKKFTVFMLRDVFKRKNEHIPLL